MVERTPRQARGKKPGVGIPQQCGMEWVLAVCAGVGLAAACGLRVFVPLLVVSAGAKLGFVDLGEQMAWLGSWPALVSFAVAAVVEGLGYLVPWIDHGLDVVATPAALAAGTVVAASQFADMGPAAGWISAAILGGGAAAATQTANVTTRAASTVTTGGTLNPFVSLLHTAGALVMSVVAVVAPIMAIAALAVVVLGVVWFWRRRRRAGAQVPVVAA
jgi:hypothetical protein